MSKTARQNRKEEHDVHLTDPNWADRRYFYFTPSDCRTCRHLKVWYRIGGSESTTCWARPLATVVENVSPKVNHDGECPFYTRSFFKTLKMRVLRMFR